MELQIRNLSKRYANGVQALDRVSLDDPARHVRPARPERRRQVDADAHARDAAGAPTRGTADRCGDIDVLRDKDAGAPRARLPAAGLRRVSEGVGAWTCSTTSRA